MLDVVRRDRRAPSWCVFVVAFVAYGGSADPGSATDPQAGETTGEDVTTDGGSDDGDASSSGPPMPVDSGDSSSGSAAADCEDVTGIWTGEGSYHSQEEEMEQVGDDCRTLTGDWVTEGWSYGFSVVRGS